MLKGGAPFSSAKRAGQYCIDAAFNERSWRQPDDSATESAALVAGAQSVNELTDSGERPATPSGLHCVPPIH